MKLQERVNDINDTVADIIVHEVRTRYRKTGERSSLYDEFDVQRIAKEIGGKEAYFQVSAGGVANVLNSIHGIKARYDDTSFQIGPSEWLPLIHIELD